MKDFLKTWESLPLVAKIILSILYGIYGNVARIVRSIMANDAVAIVLSIVVALFGGIITLIVDIVFLLMGKDIWWYV